MVPIDRQTFFDVMASFPSGVAIVTTTTGDGTPFVVATDRADELRLQAAAGFPIDAATNTLFVAFDELTLLAGIDFAAAAVDGDGVIRIVPGGANEAFVDVFEANVEAAAGLFDDDDGDGLLDFDEGMLDDELARP